MQISPLNVLPPMASQEVQQELPLDIEMEASSTGSPAAAPAGLSDSSCRRPMLASTLIFEVRVGPRPALKSSLKKNAEAALAPSSVDGSSCSEVVAEGDEDDESGTEAAGEKHGGGDRSGEGEREEEEDDEDHGVHASAEDAAGLEKKEGATGVNEELAKRTEEEIQELHLKKREVTYH